MSLDVHLSYVNDGHTTEVYEANITHNLVPMAKEVGIYKHLWRPEELGIVKASELIEPLTEGLKKLHAEPERLKCFEPENKWGRYENLVDFVKFYLAACKDYPNATISVSR